MRGFKHNIGHPTDSDNAMLSLAPEVTVGPHERQLLLELALGARNFMSDS